MDMRPREQAFWEKGLFANQNVAAKLRRPFTLQRLGKSSARTPQALAPVGRWGGSFGYLATE
jgi:hypothetical protein